MNNNTEPIKKDNFLKVLLFYGPVIFIALAYYEAFTGYGSSWNFTHMMFDYSLGFIPRGLIGTLGRIFFGSLWGRSYIFYFLTQGLCLCFFLYLIYKYSGLYRRKNNYIISVVIWIFAIGVFPKILIDTVGYYEQFCIPIIILFIEISLNKDWRFSMKFSALFCLISVMISESNAFFVCPVLASIGTIKFVYENKDQIRNMWKEFVIHAFLFIPTLLFVIYAHSYSMSQDMLDRWIEKIEKAEPDFAIGYSIFPFFQDRSLNHIEETFADYGWYYIAAPLIIVAFVLIYFLCVKEYLIGIMYTILGVLCSYCSLIYIYFAWDIYRAALWAYLSILFLTVFCLSYVTLKPIPLQVKVILSMLAFIWILIGKENSYLFAPGNGWSTDRFRTLNNLFTLLGS